MAASLARKLRWWDTPPPRLRVCLPLSLNRRARNLMYAASLSLSDASIWLQLSEMYRVCSRQRGPQQGTEIALVNPPPYIGSPLIRNIFSLGPYFRTMHRTLWCSGAWTATRMAASLARKLLWCPPPPPACPVHFRAQREPSTRNLAASPSPSQC